MFFVSKYIITEERARGSYFQFTPLYGLSRRNFKIVIDKAVDACSNSENQCSNHFVDINKMVQIGSGTKRAIEDIMLSRYACYLIVQNGDSRQ